MRIIGKKILLKCKKKNIGNKLLCQEIDKLIDVLELFEPYKTKQTIKDLRPDADCVHNDGFYFFDIHIHRTLILIELDDEGEATIMWAGTHQEYDETFKNNKSTIEKWLRTKNYID
ncbi:addiction module toxin RelE [Sphingobacterium sp. ML3W]|uniref:type II toxin-antitoxin system HigB family toxin n=1 Tax=Sphingobacterium sp. ML3W TaxID=1538644 RepID=UPI0004F730CB|nr:type II toxin-antitoxin system HigB family toxin [Sphingobacterium sp. ML3W]AIM38121.1 addiction module toxin RelE [Sphingobacterium sp. ML3W]